MAGQESLEEEIEKEYAGRPAQHDISGEPPGSAKLGQPGKIGGIRFFVIAILGAVIESIAAGLSTQTLLIWALIASIIGYPFFLKARKAKKPDAYVYGTVFFSSAVFSVLGIIAVYIILREKGLAE
jgi:hypothetical protein